MAKPIARKPGAHVSESTVISFTKDIESGYYKKIEQKTKIDHLDYKAKKIGKPTTSEKLYEIYKEIMNPVLGILKEDSHDKRELPPETYATGSSFSESKPKKRKKEENEKKSKRSKKE